METTSIERRVGGYVVWDFHDPCITLMQVSDLEEHERVQVEGREDENVQLGVWIMFSIGE